MSILETDLQFAAEGDEQGNYKLLEMPAEILKLVEQGSLDR
jgi:hypothetical protein